MASGALGGRQQGFPWRQVRVQGVYADRALCVDSMGTPFTVTTQFRRGGGPLPRVGEVWVIDRTLGNWTFAALVTGDPPEITGSNDGIPALVNLLAALDEMGLIVDRTTPDRIRADTPHTH